MTAIINFRKILNENFLLFITSVILFLQIFNQYIGNDPNMYNVIKTVELIIPFSIAYIFTVVILTPLAKIQFIILSFIQFFPFIDKIVKFFKTDKDEIPSNMTGIQLTDLRNLAIEQDNSILYKYYEYHKDEEEKEMFTSKFSFLNIILMLLNYILINDGYVRYILNLINNEDSFIAITAIFFELLVFLMLFYAMRYMKPNHYKVYLDDIKIVKEGNKTS